MIDVKSKIEEIVSEYTDFVGNTDDPLINLKMDKEHLVNRLSTLFTEQRADAVKGFVEYFETHKWHRYSTSIFLHEALEEYLKEQNI